jgi:hypothetical protein
MLVLSSPAQRDGPSLRTMTVPDKVSTLYTRAAQMYFSPVGSCSPAEVLERIPHPHHLQARIEEEDRAAISDRAGNTRRRWRDGTSDRASGTDSTWNRIRGCSLPHITPSKTWPGVNSVRDFVQTNIVAEFRTTRCCQTVVVSQKSIDINPEIPSLHLTELFGCQGGVIRDGDVPFGSGGERCKSVWGMRLLASVRIAKLFRIRCKGFVRLSGDAVAVKTQSPKLMLLAGVLPELRKSNTTVTGLPISGVRTR